MAYGGLSYLTQFWVSDDVAFDSASEALAACQEYCFEILPEEQSKNPVGGYSYQDEETGRYSCWPAFDLSETDTWDCFSVVGFVKGEPSQCHGRGLGLCRSRPIGRCVSA
jgi:hypothetical protein